MCYETKFRFDGVPAGLAFAHSIPHRGGYDGASMNQTIMQGPSVCPYFATRSLSSGLVGSGDSKKNAGGKINETSNGVVLFCRHPSCEHVE